MITQISTCLLGIVLLIGLNTSCASAAIEYWRFHSNPNLQSWKSTLDRVANLPRKIKVWHFAFAFIGGYGEIFPEVRFVQTMYIQSYTLFDCFELSAIVIFVCYIFIGKNAPDCS